MPRSPTVSSDQNLLALNPEKVIGKKRQGVLRGYKRECMRVPSFVHTMKNSQSTFVKACGQPFHSQGFRYFWHLSRAGSADDNLSRLTMWHDVIAFCKTATSRPTSSLLLCLFKSKKKNAKLTSIANSKFHRKLLPAFKLSALWAWFEST